MNYFESFFCRLSLPKFVIIMKRSSDSSSSMIITPPSKCAKTTSTIIVPSDSTVVIYPASTVVVPREPVNPSTQSSLLLVQFVHENDGSGDFDCFTGYTFLIPKAFFEDETRCPGAKRAFESLCNKDAYLYNKVNGLIVSAFLNLRRAFPTPKEVRDNFCPGSYYYSVKPWRKEAKNQYKAEFSRDFDADIYSWAPFEVRIPGSVSLNGKEINFEKWYSKYFEDNDDDDDDEDKEVARSSIDEWKLHLLSSSSYICEYVCLQTP